MTEPWALPGYDVQALLGCGATGEVWRARQLTSGQAVALKKLRAPVSPAALASLRQRATMVRSLDSPYVVRLRAVLADGADTVLVLDLAAGGSLAGLLARRDRLEPGELVTVAGPLAAALAEAHARGLVHGGVSTSNILFTAEGMPLLAEFGLDADPGVDGPGAPDAPSDVWDLAAVCHRMLAGSSPRQGARLGQLAPSAPRPLVDALERALQAEPSARPDAASLAAALRRSHPAEPVRLSYVSLVTRPRQRGEHVGRPVRAARHRPRRALAVGVGAMLALALAASVGWLSGRSAPTGAGELAAVTVAPDWVAVLDRLDTARALAFERADPARLADVYDPGATGLSVDRTSVERLLAAGQRARGVRHTVRRVIPLRYDGRTARLSVVDVLPAYDVLGSDGAVLSRSAPRAEATYRVDLVLTGDGWRLHQVTPV